MIINELDVVFKMLSSKNRLVIKRLINIKRMKKLFLLLTAITLTQVLGAQTILGTWKTIDDATKEAKSYVQLYEQNGKVFGKITKLLVSSPDRKCDQCPGARKDQPILNMVILENLTMKDGFYQDGQILDPEKGKWYTCKVWLKEGDPNALQLRGYLGFFYRTQTWYRVQ